VRSEEDPQTSNYAFVSPILDSREMGEQSQE